MHAFGDMAKALNRSTAYLSALQKRFELPVMDGPAYSNAYLEFLRALVMLRTLNISEESLRDLWQLEKKLLQLIHVDSSAGSPTWFLDSCGATTHPERRLLLTNHDLGIHFACTGGSDPRLFGSTGMSDGTFTPRAGLHPAGRANEKAGPVPRPRLICSIRPKQEAD